MRRLLSTFVNPPIALAAIRAAALAGRWALTRHARERIGRRRIADEQFVQALVGGEVIEDYATVPRGPGALVLGRASDGTPLHAVFALDPSGTLLVITAYVPESPYWLDERTRGPRQSR